MFDESRAIVFVLYAVAIITIVILFYIKHKEHNRDDYYDYDPDKG